jgi:hypothetical protein
VAVDNAVEAKKRARTSKLSVAAYLEGRKEERDEGRTGQVEGRKGRKEGPEGRRRKKGGRKEGYPVRNAKEGRGKGGKELMQEGTREGTEEGIKEGRKEGRREGGKEGTHPARARQPETCNMAAIFGSLLAARSICRSDTCARFHRICVCV